MRVTLGARHPAMVRLREVPIRMPVRSPRIRRAATAPSGAALKYDADTVQEALTRVCRPRPVYHASSRISSEHIHETILGLLWMMGARTSSTPDGQLAGAGAAGIVAPATDTIAVQNGEEKSGTTAESGAEALSQSIPDVLPESVRKAKNLMHRG